MGIPPLSSLLFMNLKYKWSIVDSLKKKNSRKEKRRYLGKHENHEGKDKLKYSCWNLTNLPPFANKPVLWGNILGLPDCWVLFPER